MDLVRHKWNKALDYIDTENIKHIESYDDILTHLKLKIKEKMTDIEVEDSIEQLFKILTSEKLINKRDINHTLLIDEGRDYTHDNKFLEMMQKEENGENGEKKKKKNEKLQKLLKKLDNVIKNNSAFFHVKPVDLTKPESILYTYILLLLKFMNYPGITWSKFENDGKFQKIFKNMTCKEQDKICNIPQRDPNNPKRLSQGQMHEKAQVADIEDKYLFNTAGRGLKKRSCKEEPYETIRNNCEELKKVENSPALLKNLLQIASNLNAKNKIEHELFLQIISFDNLMNIEEKDRTTYWYELYIIDTFNKDAVDEFNGKRGTTQLDHNIMKHILQDDSLTKLFKKVMKNNDLKIVNDYVFELMIVSIFFTLKDIIPKEQQDFTKSLNEKSRQYLKEMQLLLENKELLEVDINPSNVPENIQKFLNDNLGEEYLKRKEDYEFAKRFKMNEYGWNYNIISSLMKYDYKNIFNRIGTNETKFQLTQNELKFTDYVSKHEDSKIFWEFLKDIVLRYNYSKALLISGLITVTAPATAPSLVFGGIIITVFLSAIHIMFPFHNLVVKEHDKKNQRFREKQEAQQIESLKKILSDDNLTSATDSIPNNDIVNILDAVDTELEHFTRNYKIEYYKKILNDDIKLEKKFRNNLEKSLVDLSKPEKIKNEIRNNLNTGQSIQQSLNKYITTLKQPKDYTSHIYEVLHEQGKYNEYINKNEHEFVKELKSFELEKILRDILRDNKNKSQDYLELLQFIIENKELNFDIIECATNHKYMPCNTSNKLFSRMRTILYPSITILRPSRFSKNMFTNLYNIDNKKYNYIKYHLLILLKKWGYNVDAPAVAPPPPPAAAAPEAAVAPAAAAAAAPAPAVAAKKDLKQILKQILKKAENTENNESLIADFVKFINTNDKLKKDIKKCAISNVPCLGFFGELFVMLRRELYSGTLSDDEKQNVDNFFKSIATKLVIGDSENENYKNILKLVMNWNVYNQTNEVIEINLEEKKELLRPGEDYKKLQPIQILRDLNPIINDIIYFKGLGYLDDVTEFYKKKFVDEPQKNLEDLESNKRKFDIKSEIQSEIQSLNSWSRDVVATIHMLLDAKIKALKAEMNKDEKIEKELKKAEQKVADKARKEIVKKIEYGLSVIDSEVLKVYIIDYIVENIKRMFKNQESTSENLETEYNILNDALKAQITYLKNMKEFNIELFKDKKKIIKEIFRRHVDGCQPLGNIKQVNVDYYNLIKAECDLLKRFESDITSFDIGKLKENEYSDIYNYYYNNILPKILQNTITTNPSQSIDSDSMKKLLNHNQLITEMNNCTNKRGIDNLFDCKGSEPFKIIMDSLIRKSDTKGNVYLNILAQNDMNNPSSLDNGENALLNLARRWNKNFNKQQSEKTARVSAQNARKAAEAAEARATAAEKVVEEAEAKAAAAEQQVEEAKAAKAAEAKAKKEAERQVAEANAAAEAAKKEAAEAEAKAAEAAKAAKAATQGEAEAAKKAEAEAKKAAKKAAEEAEAKVAAAEEAKRQAAEAKAQAEAAKRQAAEAERQAAEANAALADAEAARSKAEEAARGEAKKAKAALADAEAARGEAEEAKANAAEANAAAEKLQDTLDTKNEEVERLTDELEKAKEDVERLKSELDDEKFKVNNRNAELRRMEIVKNRAIAENTVTKAKGLQDEFTFNKKISELEKNLKESEANMETLSKNLSIAEKTMEMKRSDLKQITESRDQLKSIMVDYGKLHKLKNYFDELETQKQDFPLKPTLREPFRRLFPIEKGYIQKQTDTLQKYLESVESLTDDTINEQLSLRQKLTIDLINNYSYLFEFYKKNKEESVYFDKIHKLNINPNRTAMATAIMNIGNNIIDSNNKKVTINLDELKSHSKEDVDKILPNFTQAEKPEEPAQEVGEDIKIYNDHKTSDLRPLHERVRTTLADSTVNRFVVLDPGSKGGSIQNYDYNLSSRSIDRLQNVGIFNIVKFLRLGYYNNSSEKETIESLIFKDYLITIIISIVLHSLRLNKLSIGILVDQILSMGMYYKYKNEKFLLLPYYLPFV